MDEEFSQLEDMVMEDMRRLYSEQVIDHFLKPRNLGQVPQPDGFGRVTGSCGDTMEIGLRVRNGMVAAIAFGTDGCGPSIASGSMVTEMARGRPVAEALGISQQDVLDSLGGLPAESQHCALLAADTLKAALRDYLATKNEPWKRAYRDT